MGRHYSFEDLNTSEKPRIRAGEYHFAGVVYRYVCTGRTSVGYGTSPEHAYARWHRNWTRRYGFYKRREEHARAVLLPINAVLRRIR